MLSATSRSVCSQQLYYSKLQFRLQPQQKFSPTHKLHSFPNQKTKQYHSIQCALQQEVRLSEAFLNSTPVIERFRVEKFIKQLDEEQIGPVKADLGATVVTAGPGSGKTRVLVGRIGHLADMSIRLNKILAVTFSRRADREMKKRLEDEIFGANAKNINVGTFHSICFRIIRDYYKRNSLKKAYVKNSFLLKNPNSSNQQTSKQHIIGNNNGNISPEPSENLNFQEFNQRKNQNGVSFNQNFVNPSNPYIPTILDQDSQERVARKIFKNMGFSSGSNEVIETYSYIRNTSSSIQEINEKLDQIKNKDKVFVEFVNQYELHKQKCNELDFDDILLKTIQILESDEQFLQLLLNKFDHVLVDEFQDTNLPQFRILELITQNHNYSDNKSIFVVGDVNQCIYKFRGSLVNIFERFKYLFPQYTSYSLSRNYRSNKNVVDFSASLNRISGNIIPGNQVQQSLKPICNKYGPSLKLFKAISNYEEGDKIYAQIEFYKQKGIKPNEISVLYRTHFQGNVLASLLRRKGLKFIQQGGFTFWNRKEVKTLRQIFQLLINYRSSALDQLYKVIGLGVGEVSYRKLSQDGKRANETLLEDVKNFKFENNEISEDFLGIMRLSATRNGKSFKEKLQILETCREMWEELEEKAIGQLPEFILTVGMRKQTKMFKGINKIRAFYVILRNVLEQIQIDKYKDAILLAYCCLFEKREQIKDVYNVADAIDIGLDCAMFQELKPSEDDDTEFNMVQILELMEQKFQQEEEAIKNPEKCVKLMTVHASKGLEFKVVFIVGLVKGEFPIEKEDGGEEELQDELRLFYVGVTRAKEYLVLSTVDNTRKSSYGNDKVPSMFFPPY